VRISKKFLRSSLIYSLAGTLPVASAIILLPFYVTHLSTSDFGALAIYFGFSFFVQLLTTYSFDTSLYIHYHELKSDKAKLSAFVSSAFVFMLLLGGVMGVVSSIFGELAFRNIFTEQNIAFRPYGFMAAATGIFQALFKVHNNLLQSRERPDLYLWSNVLSFGIIASATIIGLELYPETLIGPVGGRLVAAVLSWSWALFRIFREFGIAFDFPLLRSSFSFNFYTFIYQLLQWVINYFDRIFMVFFLALSDVGVYDFAVKCLLVIEFILNGLHNSFYPRLVSTVMAQERKRSTPEFNRYYHGLIAVTLVLICGCILTYPYAIEWFVRKPGYDEAVRYVPYIALIYIFRAIRLFFAAPYNILQYAKPLSAIYLGISVLKISVMWAAIDRVGLFGVIAASMIAAVAEIGMLRWGLQGKFEFRYNAFKVLVAPALMFAIIIICEPLFGSRAPLMLHSFYLIICLALLAWVYRREIAAQGTGNSVRN